MVYKLRNSSHIFLFFRRQPSQCLSTPARVTSFSRLLQSIFISTAVLLCLPQVTVEAADPPEHLIGYSAPGFNPSQPGAAGFGDGVNTKSGALNVAHTVLSLGQKGNLPNLTIGHVYNSKTVKNYYSVGVGGDVDIAPTRQSDSWAGYGWTFILGAELLNYPDHPVLILPDGSEQYFYREDGSSDTFRTQGFWRLQRFSDSAIVSSPNGVRYRFSNDVFRRETETYGTVTSYTTYLLATGMFDVHNHAINFFYKTDTCTDPAFRVPGGLNRPDYIRDSYGRRIAFEFHPVSGAWCDTGQLPRIKQVTGAGRTVTYDTRTFTSGGGTFDRTVNQLKGYTQEDSSPANVDLTYSYGYDLPGGRHELTSVTLPSGAQSVYRYENHTFYVSPTNTVSERVITTRTLGGVLGGRIWRYEYPTRPPTYNASTYRSNQIYKITDPLGNYVQEIYRGYDEAASATTVGQLLWREYYSAGNRLLRKERFGYDGVPVSSDTVDTRFNHRATGTVLISHRIYESPQFTRPLQWTLYSDFDEYGNARTIEQHGIDATTHTTTTGDRLNIVSGGNYLLGLMREQTVNGLTTSYEYNDAGQVAEVTFHDEPVRVTTYRYYGDDAGDDSAYRGMLKWVRRSGSAGDETRTTYIDGYDYGVPTLIRDDLGVLITLTAREDGAVITQTDARNNEVRFAYTDNGLLINVERPLVADRTITYALNRSTPTVTVTQGSNRTEYQYNTLYKPVGTINADGVRSCTTYDGLGRAVKQALPRRSPACTSPTTRNYTETFFDGLSRVTRSELHVGSGTYRTTHRYDELATRFTTDPERRTTEFKYNGLGELHRVKDAKGLTTRYDYTALGHVDRVTQNGSLIRSFTYSPGGLLETEHHPESGLTHYTYNHFGQVLTRTQGLGTMLHAYDDRGRPTSITYPDGRHPIEFYYGNTGPHDACTPSTQCRDRLTEVIDETGWTVYSKYNANGKVKEKRVTLVGDSRSDILHEYTVAYTYDTLGRLETMHYPSDRVIHYTYDALNRPTKIEQELGETQTVVQDMTYNAVSMLDTMEYGNGVHTDWDYNRKFLPSKLAVDYGTEHLLQLEYQEYDAVDNLKKLVVNGQVERFGYDDIDRLTSASLQLPEGNKRLNYHYDEFGNRRSRSSDIASIASQNITYRNNRMDRDEFRELRFTYDANGNLASDGDHHYVFTANNKLRNVDGDAVIYYYNHAGQRVKTVHADGSIVLTAYEMGRAVTRWKVNP